MRLFDDILNTFYMNHTIQKESQIVKQILFVSLFSFLSSFYSYAQSNVEEGTVNVSNSSEPVDTVAIQQKIKAIDDHINAINIKTNYINNNPEEKALAESNGWFVEMANIKSELLVKKSLLEEKIK